MIRAIIASTVILGVAGLLAALARRSSASVRHAIWFVGLTTALAVTIGAAVMPTIEVESTLVNGAGASPFAPPFIESVREAALAPMAPAITGPELPAPARSRVTPRQLMLAIWLIGVVIIIGRAVFGHVAAARLIRRGHPLDAARYEMVYASAGRAGVITPVDVRISADVDGPFTLGARRPVVLLPAEAEYWDAERMRIVLVHELAHVARLDYVAQLVATATCAVYWFNPIVWVAAARLRAEAEHAADDRVLATGVDGVTYASHLLELARPETGALSTAMAVGMARNTNRLERRFTAMLDSTRSRGIVPLRLQAVAGTAAMLVAVPLTGLRVIPVEMASVAQIIAPLAEKSPVVAPTLVAGGTARTVAASAAIAAEGDTVIERTLAAAAGEHITLDLRTGGSVTLRAWDQPQVRLRARLSGDQSHETDLTFTRVSGGLDLRTTFLYPRNNNRNSNSFELWVPRKFNMRISSAGGGIIIEGVEGTFSGNTGGGEIILDNVRGESRLNTGGGEIRVTNSQLEGFVNTGGGEALVTNTTGNLRVSSGSGPVIRSSAGGTQVYGVGGNDIRTTGGQATTTGSYDRTSTTTSSRTVIGGAQASTKPLIIVDGQVISDGGLSYTKAGGSIDLDAVPNGGSFTTGGGDINIGSAGGTLSVTTGGGDIEIGQVSGDVSATTGAGSVHITVINTNGSARNVRVSSGTGRIVIELPANIDARFDLETAYTERNGRTNIESDFPVNVTETEEWDARNGTPRRFVRATGTAGSGRGLVRIRTVNGDVVIRRR